MASAPERLRLKDRIVASVATSVKSIQEYQVACGCGDDPVTLTNTDRPCQRLTENFDHVFLHGLRHINYGYWKVVKEFTRKDAVKEICRLRNITTDLGRGRAWLMMTLNECVLESYIRCYLDNKKLVKKHYVREAFVLDEQRMNVLLTLTSGLEYAIFHLDYDVPYLDLGTYPPGSRSRTSSANSALQDDDHASLCSMDSITSTRGRNMSFTAAVEYTGKSCNAIDTQSQNSEDTGQSKGGSVDSGILVSDRDNHVDYKRSSFPRGHDRELSLEEQEEEFKVIRVSSSRKKKKSVKKGHAKVHREEVLQEDVSVLACPDTIQHQNSCLSQEPSLSDILDFDDRDYSELPDRSPGDGMESSQESLNANLLHRGNDKTKVMENYNIAFVDMSKEDLDYNIYKHTPIQNSQSDYFNVYKDSQNTHSESIEHEALDLAATSKSGESISAVVSSVNDLPVKNDIGEEKGKTVASKSELGVIDEKCSQPLEGTSQACDNTDGTEDVSVNVDNTSDVDLNEHIDKTPEILTCGNVTTSSPDKTDIVGKSAINSSSSNQKSATSEMQDRVNDMINQTNTHLGRHMFEEEPEDTDIENGNVLEEEEKTVAGEVRLNNNTKLYLMLDVFDDTDEEFIKAFASRTGHTEGEAKTVFLLVTNRALHLLSQAQSDHRFVKDSSIPYQQLDYISLSLSDQVIQIVCLNRRKQFWITTGSQLVTRSIVGCLSQAIDKGGFDIPKISVLTDATTQKIALRKYAAQECKCETSAVEICCYSLVHWDDPTAKGDNSDSTYKEGHLLYKMNEVGASLGSTLLSTVQDPAALIYGTSWKPAYVVLKDGMLCVYSSKAVSKPLHFVQLGGDDCIGCRHASNTDRDHCIQVIMASGTTWHIALATDVEANQWLQSLCRAVAQGLEKTPLTVNCLPCCLVLTPQKLLMCHEDVQTSFFRTLGSANLLDITNVLTDPAVSNYCVLEFESHDQGVSADQWVLYFNDGSETQRFMQALSSAWSIHYKVGVPDMTITDVSLQKNCRDMVTRLGSSLEVRQ
ncbi:pleckstrin homology domain-containing family M member 2-like [Mizuhopecten yessoensis]|uniref:Pleckstrin homology domain-containing family M member 2 n=1 Tax=Mizuhopecten yessoensis TaxID=6573 RepID=A0A210PXL4_MIZYE|nr:pleckstrin homology domain-containing family M member 2-like [Mizuhopecten yessoensis]OWF41230.1 Pleckstrin homology domain-containing family M member 2 [Mizuhopecten yessoensis]